MERWYYLALDLLSIAFPLAASFEPRIAYWRKWRGLFTGIAVMMIVFIAWDALFTANGVWGFNDRYTLGVRFLHLPLEEWLFFIAIPYSCIYLYEVMRFVFKHDPLARLARPLATAVALVLAIVGALHSERLYTSITFLSTAALLIVHLLILRTPWLGRFWMGYAISLVPFFIVNGILTGTGLPEPIVWYNDAENLGIRMGTIPVEDSIYLLFFLLLALTFHERALRRDQLSV